MDGKHDFIRKARQKFPKNSQRGIQGRLDLNLKSSRKHLKFCKNEQREAVKDAMNWVNDWNQRTNLMPKVTIRNKTEGTEDIYGNYNSIMTMGSVQSLP